MNNNEVISDEIDLKHTLPNYMSFAVLMLGLNGMQFVVLQQYTFFYETKIKMDIGLMLLAGVFYTIWDMINDPLVGHISDRNYGFTSKYGKRLPWIIFSSILMIISLVLLFMPPSISKADGWLTFIWFLLTLSLFDGFLSAILVNYQALLPVKFRTKEERVNVGTFMHIFMMLGPFIGLIFVGAIVTEDPKSFGLLSFFLGGFVLTSLLFAIPGLREEEELKQSYLKEIVKRKPFLTEFKSNIKHAFQERSFVVLAIVTFSITITSALIAVSTPYYVEYVYGLTDPDQLGETIVMVSAPFVATTILFTPLFFWIIKKIGHQKAFKYALLISPIPLLIIFSSFVLGGEASLPLVMIGAGLYGLTGGIIVIANIPLRGDYFDFAANKYKKRNEGTYLGIWNFFSRLVTVIQLGVLFLIHTLTSFNTEVDVQTNQAKWGIMTHFGLVPAIFLVLAAIIFMKYWDLTDEKMSGIRKELRKLRI